MVDQVVLLDEAGRRCGVADRETVHTTRTPYHLAFSCYLFDADQRVLLTRRALAKRTWPGVWTNSCCGHPLPGEAPREAVERRARAELGVQPTDLRLVLQSFSYRAVDASGIVENELCPVWVGTVDPADIVPDPDEVMEFVWVDWHSLVRVASETPRLLSPWAVGQIPLLDAALDAREGVA